MEARKLRIASFFAGVGGIDLGFEQTGLCETIYANEIDKSPVTTFEMNFDIKVDMRDINNVKVDDPVKMYLKDIGYYVGRISLSGIFCGWAQTRI